jgi:hypothetical protein
MDFRSFCDTAFAGKAAKTCLFAPSLKAERPKGDSLY